MTLYENFEGYALGTVHGQGDDVGAGDRWQVQQNSSALGDPGWVKVVDNGGDQMLVLTDRDTDGEIDTVYLSMSMSSAAITGEGTLYVRFKADGPNDTLMATNDKYPGWDYGGIDGGTAAAPLFQMTADNYSQQGAIVRLSGGEDFRAVDGSSANPNPLTGTNNYSDQPMGQQVGAWQELWMQVDHANDRVKYYLCPDNGTPTLVPNPVAGDWWYMRNLGGQDNNAVTVIKWFIGGYPWPALDTETNVIIESIAIDTTAMTTDHYLGWQPMCEGTMILLGVLGDADANWVVDLDDFVILKDNFGTQSGATWATADFDFDGDVDLDDFTALKNHFGDEYYPSDLMYYDLDGDGDWDLDDWQYLHTHYGEMICAGYFGPDPW